MVWVDKPFELMILIQQLMYNLSIWYYFERIETDLMWGKKILVIWFDNYFDAMG